MKTTHQTTGRMIKGGILIALAFVLSYFELPILPAAPWLKLDFSALPILFGGLSFGGFFGLLLTGLLQILILAIKGSTTGGVGEIANFIMLGTFTLVTASVYRRVGGMKGLIEGSILGTIALIVAAMLSNVFILIPLFFPNGFAGGEEAYKTYIYKLIPLFNLIKGGLISALGCLTYEKLGFLVRKENFQRNESSRINAA